MTRLLLALVLIASPVWAQPHGKTKVTHTKYHGGDLHEAETDGVRDGVVIWKNGTMQEIHNGTLGKWIPQHFKQEGKPRKPPAEAVPDLPVAEDASTAIIDDYILVSPKQVTAWGGIASATNKAHLAVDRMNEAFMHSCINAQTRIVGVAQDTVDELDNTFDTLLTDLHNRYAAGAFDAVRAQNGFDILSKLVVASQYCGLGYLFAYSGSYAQQVIN